MTWCCKSLIISLSSIFLQIPCNWRFLQNDCLQLMCRALQGWVTRAIWVCLREEFWCVKATCVLHNFMRMDMRTSWGSAARRHVPEERSAALQNVSRRGANSTGGNPCAGELPFPTPSKRVLFPGNTIDYTMLNQMLF